MFETQRQPSLHPCPSSPNCVSSQATDARHAIDPFVFTGRAEDAWQALKRALASMARTRIVDEMGYYLHAEARSRIFRFVDDVEFVLVPEQKTVHVRSASRTGSGDLGVNRRRVQRLRDQLRDAGILATD